MRLLAWLVLVVLAAAACAGGVPTSSDRGAAAVTGAAPTAVRQPIATPTPVPVTTPAPSPSPTTLAVDAVARIAALPREVVPMCGDSDTFAGIPVASVIRCDMEGMTLELAKVPIAHDEEGRPPWSLFWQVEGNLGMAPATADEDEDEEVDDSFTCPNGHPPYSGSYAAGDQYAGAMSACADEGWLLWNVPAIGVVGRLEAASGALDDAADWFLANRPIGTLDGRLWNAGGFECMTSIDRCGGPLPPIRFQTLSRMATPASYADLVRNADAHGDEREYLEAHGEFVRITARFAFVETELGLCGCEIKSGGGWGAPAWIPWFEGARMGRVVDVVGWAGGWIDLTDEDDPPSLLPEDYELKGPLPYILAAAVRAHD